MATKPNDVSQFANQALMRLIESAANTLTFLKLETGINVSEKTAWIINRVEYFTTFNATIFNTSGDHLAFGLSAGNSFTTPSVLERQILDFNDIAREDIGTAASGLKINTPIVKDYSTLPRGGLLIPPVPFYAWCKGTGLASAAEIHIRLYYTTLAMATEDYWELVETFRPLTA